MRKTTFKFSALLMFLLLGTFIMGQTKFTVTFNVDMSNANPFDPATDDVYISGSFAGWTEPGKDSTFKMEPSSEGNPMIYTITLKADSGMIQYKYFRVINDSASWNNGEWASEDNRITILLVDSLTFNNVWGNKPILVTFNVDMSPVDTLDPTTTDVYIAGDFAGWQMPGTIPQLMMSPSAEDSMIYTLTVSLYTGEYQYKYFLVYDDNPSWANGEWASEDNRKVKVDTSLSTVTDLWGDIYFGIFNRKAEFTYDMYPNPVTNKLTISGVNDVNRIEIFDISGRVVKSVEVASEKVSMNLSDLQSGVYIISLHNAKGI
ncbi:MAG TPA: T9SS type A sorting domain-containing protein, partial [Bacteroidetes bacterium]|nr:T9SS type A sorting domain-containing protein [Bacteroidota bacterium]